MKHDEQSLDRAERVVEAERLRAAARYISVRGWLGRSSDNQYGVCLLQALAAAHGHAEQNWACIDVPQALVEAVLQRAPQISNRCFGRTEIVFTYNDRHCPSFYSALAVLEDAALLTERSPT